jgi:hypothetical protein
LDYGWENASSDGGCGFSGGCFGGEPGVFRGIGSRGKLSSRQGAEDFDEDGSFSGSYRG